VAARPSALAKLTRPRLYDALPRPRLFERLDAARERPVVWITAPPGSGKSTLVASYTEARNLPYLWYQVDVGPINLQGKADESEGPLPSAPIPSTTRGKREAIMQIILSPSWTLTDEHSASNEGIAVLVNRETLSG
jgi:hypothetical protein